MNNKRQDQNFPAVMGLAVAAALMLAACSEADNSAEDTAAMATAVEESAADQSSAGATNAAGTAGAQVTPESVVDGVVFGEIIFGDPNAPVEIIEYASFTCPHCAAFHMQTMPQLKAEFIDTGQVQFRFRNFVRDGADLTASMVSRCGGADRAYGLIDLFFRQQGRWLNASYADELAALARRAGMNRAEFDRCLANKDLERDLIELRNAGSEEFSIAATPTFIVEGEKVEGALPFEEFAELIRDNM